MLYTSIGEHGVNGSIVVQIDNPNKEDVATDAIVRAIAPFAKKGMQAESLPHSHELLTLAAQDQHHEASGILAKVSASVPDTIAGTVVNPAPLSADLASTQDSTNASAPAVSTNTTAPAVSTNTSASASAPAVPTNTTAGTTATLNSAPAAPENTSDKQTPATSSPKESSKKS